MVVMSLNEFLTIIFIVHNIILLKGKQNLAGDTDMESQNLEVNTEGSGIENNPHLYGEFKTSLTFGRPCLKEMTTATYTHTNS